MKGKKCFIKLGLILISLFVGVVTNGTPVNAIDAVLNLTPTYRAADVGTDLRCTVDGNTIVSNPFGECNLPDTQAQILSVRNVYKNTPIDVKAGHYYSVVLAYATNEALTPVPWNINVDTDHFVLVSFKQISRDAMNSSNYCRRYNVTSNDMICSNLSFPDGWYSVYYEIIVQSIEDNDSVQFMIGNPYSASLFVAWGGQISMSSIYEYRLSDAEDEMNRKDDEDRDNLENQQGETNETAENQEGEATTTGQTLFSAFSSLVSALRNVHQTNCKLPNMSVYTITLENMDLCSVNLPSGVSALAGIAMCFIIVKMGISLVNRMLNLYKEIIG